MKAMLTWVGKKENAKESKDLGMQKDPVMCLKY